MKRVSIIALISALILSGIVIVAIIGNRNSKDNDTRDEYQQELWQETEKGAEENELPIMTTPSDKQDKEKNVSSSDVDTDSKEEKQSVETESVEEPSKETEETEETENTQEKQEPEDEVKEEDSFVSSDKSKMELPFVPAQ